MTATRPAWLTEALQVFDVHYLQDNYKPELALALTETELELTRQQVGVLVRAVNYSNLPE